MMTNRQAFDELCSYTLTHSDPKFIHQHVVDAFGAQNANEDENTIRLTLPSSASICILNISFLRVRCSEHT